MHGHHVVSSLEINSKRYYMRKLMNNNVLKLIVCAGFFCGTSFAMERNEIDYRPYIPMGKDEDWGKNLKARRQQWQRDISEHNNRIINKKILEGYGMICASPFVLCYIVLSKLCHLCPIQKEVFG